MAATQEIEPELPSEHAPADGEPRPPPTRVRSKALTWLLVLAIFYTVYFAKGLLLPVAIALLLNLLLAPLVRGLKKYLLLPNPVGAGLILLLFAGGVAAGFYGLADPTTRWLNEIPLALTEIEQKVRALKEPVENVQDAAKRVEDLANGGDTKAAGSEPAAVVVQGPGITQTVLGGAASLASGFVIVIALLYFLLAAGDTLLRQAVRSLPTLDHRRRMVGIVREMEEDVSYYLLTISVINAGLGVAVGLATYLLDMPNPVLWGVMAALFNFVPFLGAAAGIVILAVVAMVTFDQLVAMLLPPLAYLVLTSIEAQLVTPSLLARRLTLNPVVVFLALIAGTWLWGIGGALLAVPMLATFKICCDHIDDLKPIGTLLGR